MTQGHRRSRFVPLLALPLLLALIACPTTEAPDDEVADDSFDCTFSSTGGAVLDCPAPPDTFDTSSLSGTDNGSAWDAWAWTSFAAYNWPALASTDTTTYPSGYVRGVPDTAQSFTGASGDQVVVWETFKEKRELFNDDSTDGWQQVTFESQYVPQELGGTLPACSTSSQEALAQLGTYPRIFAQVSKQAPSIDGDNTLDETAEVASPAHESQDQLCAGYTTTTDPTLADCQATFDTKGVSGAGATFSATTSTDRPPVGPRVFKGSPGAANFIYYEVKLNYDYYAYLAANGLNDYDTALTQAQAGDVHLPYRTSAQAKEGGNSQAVKNYDAAGVATCYGDFPSDCGTGVTAEALPGIGSVQVKSAWLPTSLLDGDTSDYHTTEAIYFETQNDALCYQVDEFGLIGLHVIQRVHGGDSQATEGEYVGGTFIFATWEHESIADGAGYSYVNYLADGAADQTDPSPYPNTAAGLQVERLESYPLASTAAVNSDVQTALSDSVWANYRLIGTQFQAIGSESDSTALGQPYYLANLVIETNRGLQQFQGQPPNVQVIDHYSSEISQGSATDFTPSSANLVFGQDGTATGFVMGGCMGCHGIAQVQGYAFSFVLQDGEYGTTPDTADSIAIPPIEPGDPPTD